MNCEFCQAECVPLYPVWCGTLTSTMHRCENCLCCRLAPAFPEAGVRDYYENTYFQGADWEINKSTVLAVDYYRKVRPFLAGDAVLGSLDMGAGYGHFARYFSAKTGLQTDIVEPSVSCREVIAGQEGVGKIFTSLEEVPGGREYQQIFCFHVVEHLQEFGVFAAEMRRRLAARGRLFLLTPNGASSTFGEFGQKWGWSCPDQHYQFLSDRIPADYFARLGFEVIVQDDVCPATIHYPSRWLLQIEHRIARSDPSFARSRRLARLVRQGVLTLASRWLGQNRTNRNLCSVEGALARRSRGRSLDELLLVLEKAAV